MACFACDLITEDFGISVFNLLTYIHVQRSPEDVAIRHHETSHRFSRRSHKADDQVPGNPNAMVCSPLLGHSYRRDCECRGVQRPVGNEMVGHFAGRRRYSNPGPSRLFTGCNYEPGQMIDTHFSSALTLHFTSLHFTS